MLNLDRMIVEFDKGLRTLFSQAHSMRAHPDAGVPDAALSDAEKKHAAALMRVNHSGEICAQALYQGQALTARDPDVQRTLQRAAQEETEHLAWTARRVRELGGHLSVLNPFWYTGSLAIGAAAGLLGDRWNLGFLAETERQVGHHLQSHLDLLPPQDEKSRAIVAQMHADEVGHADVAVSLGGAELPQLVQLAMKLNGKVMTTLSYRV
ncbi:MAG TPA: 2-polyprenyl-3-methyl-6-methoxy-1,4-benzoquinone monooxygenase [Gallionella sp.]|nr:2-polyprenyl-3-methyl-6-methoxy-1,4-benzoquinone monooxygenase [Gallionella sp.]